jgi:hypothetical protein
MTAVPGKEIQLPAWEFDTVEHALPAMEVTDHRGEVASQLPDALMRHDPVVCLPRSRFDCVDLDLLKDHPAIDPFVTAQVAAGMSFRLLRFPFSVRPARGSRVEELRFTVQLDRLDGVDEPTVHSVYPLRLTVDEERKTEVAFEPALKLGSAVDVRAGRIGRTVTVTQPRATTVGYWSEDGADWLMRAPDKVRVTLSFSATVATPYLRWGTRRFERPYPPLPISGCQPIN